MAEFCMPSLGADMKKGTLVEWKVKPGDRVRRGDIIAEVETEKGIIEIEVFMDGVVEQFLVQPGDEVPVGEPIALIRGRGEKAAEERAARPDAAARSGNKEEPAAVRPEKEFPEEGEKKKSGTAVEKKRLKVSPAARKEAEAL